MDRPLVNYISDDGTYQMADDGWMDARMDFEYVEKSLFCQFSGFAYFHITCLHFTHSTSMNHEYICINPLPNDKF